MDDLTITLQKAEAGRTLSVVFESSGTKLAEVGWTDASIGHFPDALTKGLSKDEVRDLHERVVDVIRQNIFEQPKR